MKEKTLESKTTGLPKKILIVDDNADSRDLVVKVLRQFGYLIIQAVDGEEALKKAFSESPDLILMDRSLPKIDGLEVTRRLKREVTFKGVPIVALTAHAMRGDREKALEAGCEGYICKPFDVRTLGQQIKSYLEGPTGRVGRGEKE